MRIEHLTGASAAANLASLAVADLDREQGEEPVSLLYLAAALDLTRACR